MQKDCKMKNINRADAIEILCNLILTSLSSDVRDGYILDWWGIDEDSPDFSALSEDIKSLLLEHETPPPEINKIYNPIISIALKNEFKGVTNSYLSDLMLEKGLELHTVTGTIEQLEPCPCCGYRTLTTIHEYEICSLCNWEDTVPIDPEKYNPANQSSLNRAKEIFRKMENIMSLGKWARD